MPLNNTALEYYDANVLRLPADKRKEKGVEYFLLVRDPEVDPNTGEVKAITGQDLTSASVGQDPSLKPIVQFRSDWEKASAERTQPGAACHSSTACGDGEPPRTSHVDYTKGGGVTRNVRAGIHHFIVIMCGAVASPDI